MFICCYLIFIGSYQQMVINWHNYSPISSIPTGISFLASTIMSLGIGLLIIARLIVNIVTLFRGGKV